ncbi:hypothetical protein [Albibacillus kandeliae]|nr:hypothetical protein [Albibacillus kandeliae]
MIKTAMVLAALMALTACQPEAGVGFTGIGGSTVTRAALDALPGIGAD